MNIKTVVSVIIPTLNAEARLPALLNILDAQSVPPDEIIVIDSETEDKTTDICRQYGVKLIPIKRKDFDHGGTRNLGVTAAKGDYLRLSKRQLLKRTMNKGYWEFVRGCL